MMKSNLGAGGWTRSVLCAGCALAGIVGAFPACSVNVDDGDAEQKAELQGSCDSIPNATAQKLESRLLQRVCSPDEGEKSAATVWLVLDETRFGKLPVDAVSEDLWKAVVPEFRRVRAQFLALAARSYPDVSIEDRGGSDPFVTVVATREDMVRLAAEPLVGQLSTSIEDSERDLVPASSQFPTTENFAILNFFGVVGTGVTVSCIEGGGYWTSVANLDGVPSGSCVDTYGTSFACSDPSLSPTNTHVAQVASVIRTSAGGVAEAAPGATLVNGASQNGIEAAVDWSLAQNARVINRSAASGGTTQSAYERYMDYVAMWKSHAPVIVASAGNSGVGSTIGHRLHNGLVVGGTDDATPRTSVGIWSGSQSVNVNGANGWELPHIVAQAQNVDIANTAPGSTGLSTGTSFSAPQVSGAAARAIGSNSTLVDWNVAVMAGIMATGFNVDGPELDLADGVDDRDGAGLLDASAAITTLQSSSKRDGGNTPAQYGHDYDILTSSTLPAGTWHPETYYATVPAGKTLKIASVMFASSFCWNTSSGSTCPASPLPLHWLYITAPGFSKLVSNSSQGYQFATIVNSTGSTQTYTFRVYMADWAGAYATKRGIAWYVR